jgi:hypothetical protein
VPSLTSPYTMKEATSVSADTKSSGHQCMHVMRLGNTNAGVNRHHDHFLISHAHQRVHAILQSKHGLHVLVSRRETVYWLSKTAA